MLLIENISHCNMTRETQVSFLMIRLVYFIKYVLMDIGKGNNIRSVCRSLEILLFFVISIVGFNVFLKTTSLNSKSKSKLLSGGTPAPRELAIPDNSHTRHYGLERIHGFFRSQPQQSFSSYTIHSGTPPFPDILHHQHHFLNHNVGDVNNSDLTSASPLLKPDNLLQQNPVLLI
jgi:hypothetical protein